MVNLNRAATIEDLRALAHRRLPEFVFQPMETGSGNGDGPRRNVECFKGICFRPEPLANVDAATHEVTIFDRTYSQPFGIAPIGFADYFRRNSDMQFADAAKCANIPFVLSGGSIAPIETIARFAPLHTWVQLYAARDPSVTDDFLHRARDAGIDVLVVTVDVPVLPQNDWLIRSRLRLPASLPVRSLPYVLWQALTHPGWTREWIGARGFPKMDSWRRYAPHGSGSAGIHRYYRSQVPAPQTWRDIDFLRRSWPGKLVIKGLLTATSAVQATNLGVDAITVSNHGGNVLDCLPAALESLPPIRAALGDNFPVFFDGGIRRGSDILAAYALGASFCFIGRAALYGLAAGGRAGVVCAIDILQRELTQTMAMLGVPCIARTGPDLIHRMKPATV